MSELTKRAIQESLSASRRNLPYGSAEIRRKDGGRSVVGGRTQDRALLRKGEQEADIPCI